MDLLAVRLFPSRRRRARPRSLGEGECYLRLHGDRSADVRIVHLEPRRRRYPVLMTGEHVRTLFEARLKARAPEHH